MRTWPNIFPIFFVYRDPTCALNMERLLEARILSAVDLRRSLGLPSVHTNAYRLINSEGDRYILFLSLDLCYMVKVTKGTMSRSIITRSVISAELFGLLVLEYI